MYDRKQDSVTQYQREVRKTFKKHRALTATEAALLDWTLGLPGEVGEVCELVKHHIFHNEPMDKMKIAKELGDVLWYVTAVCSQLDIPIDSTLALNINKLRHRYGLKNTAYDHSKSANRHENEEKFSDTEIYKMIKADILGEE